jgi:hypothetical protein
MKKLLQAFFLLLITILPLPLLAQPGQAMARIHAAKMAYITDRLQLSPDQSANFIPLYNEYEREIRDTRQSYFKKYKGEDMEHASDGAAMQYIDDNLDYQQQVLDIKRKYNDRFLKTISPQQLTDLYKAEREFKQLLLQRLKDRNGGGGRGMRRDGKGY